MQRSIRLAWLGRLLLGMVIVSSSGCSVYSLPGSTPAPVEDRPDYGGYEAAPSPEVETVPDRDDSEPTTVAAYGPLLDQAETARTRGDYEQALTLLERAQRIDPDNPEIYLAMARTHDARGDYAQARAVAERGLLYCRGGMDCESLRAFIP
jgi:tetratricopeptide (TPR) repeat protein